MASVNWKKLKGDSMTSAMIAHATRHDFKEDVSYKNKDIDDTKLGDNYVIGGFPQYAETIKRKLEKRVKELDQIKPPKRVRADRVTSIGFNMTAPRGLSREQNEAFFKMAWEEVAKTCGGVQNVSVGLVHADEIHQYKDVITGKIVDSLEHMHMFGVPWTDEHGINGKHFMTRERIRDLNKCIDERCREMFNIPFMTGEKDDSGRDVNALKLESLKQEVEELTNKATELENRLFEANLQLFSVDMTLGEEKAKLGKLERYRAMEKWMADSFYHKNKGLATEHRVSLLEMFEKAYKKTHAKDKGRSDDITR